MMAQLLALLPYIKILGCGLFVCCPQAGVDSLCGDQNPLTV